MMTSVNCIFLRFIYDLWHRYWQLVLIVYLQDLLYPHSMSGGYIAIWPCPSVRLSVRSHFRNIYLCFYWKKWFYIWYMALAWWLVPCLPFPGLSHIYFLFTVRLRIFHVCRNKNFCNRYLSFYWKKWFYIWYDPFSGNECWDIYKFDTNERVGYS